MDDAHKAKFPKATRRRRVAIDVKTGEILSMASLPTYDPKMFLGGISKKNWEDLNDKSSEYPLTNRAIQAQYPAASTFKAMTGLAGLENGVITPSSTFVTVRAAGSTWASSGRSGAGITPATAPRASRRRVRDSCDVYFYNVGYQFYKTGGEKLQKFARTFGFGADSGIDLPGEADGRVPDATWKVELQRELPRDAAAGCRATRSTSRSARATCS